MIDSRVFFLCFLLLSELCAHAGRKYISPTPGEIPIVAVTPCPEVWIETNETRLPTKTDFIGLRECGFNVATKGYWFVDQMDSVMSNIKDTGVKFMLAGNPLKDSSRPDLCGEVVRRFMEDPDLGLWQIGDEPKYSDLLKWSAFSDTIAEYDPNHMVYLNLNCTPSEPKEGDEGYDRDLVYNGDYGKYLDIIDRLFSPAVWSYDLYPFYMNGDKQVINGHFYKFLEIFSKKSVETGRPFWAYCLGMQYNRIKEATGDTVFRSAVPSECTLRFEAFSALAYGAQGLLYWTYAQRPGYGNERYGPALVDTLNVRTPIWDAARTVNEEIHDLSEVFLGAEPVAIRHTGEIPEGTVPLEEGIGPFRSVVTDGKGVLISHLRTSGRDYIVVVSHDYSESQDISLLLSEGSCVWKVTYGMNKEAVTDTESVVLTLPPSGYSVFEWIQEEHESVDCP